MSNYFEVGEQYRHGDQITEVTRILDNGEVMGKELGDDFEFYMAREDKFHEAFYKKLNVLQGTNVCEDWS